MSGSSSRRPVATSTRRAETRRPSASRTRKPRGRRGTQIASTVPATISAAVAAHLVAAGGQQLGGRHPVAGQEALHVGGGGVAGLAGVHHQDPAAGPGQDQGRGQAGGAATDHHHVVFAHGSEAVRRGARWTTIVAVSGKPECRWAAWSDAPQRRSPPRSTRSAPAEAAAHAARRHPHRLAETTGISKSTLSRLENGQRRPSLELLLAAGAGLPGAAGRPGRRARGRRPADPAQAAAVKGRTVSR